MKVFVITTLCALALVEAAFGFDSSSVPSAPAGLLVNGVRDPLAIDRDETRFTWRSVDTVRGERQTAYQILVSTNSDHLAAGAGDWWDSGKVLSDKSASVGYTGKTLPPATRFWWKVRIWDETGNSSHYSAPAFFDTGLNQNEWTGRSIWDGTTNPNNFAYFRKTFPLRHRPVLAKVFVTAHNDYLLYCNGQLVGRGPARCDPYHYGQYNAYDVTKLLTQGTNVFAAAGHWLGTWNDSGINAEPAFLLQARFESSDGSSSGLASDETWKVLAVTPFIETNATYFGGTAGAKNRAAIQFDSQIEPSGWRSLRFDASAWGKASLVDRSEYRLFAQMAPLEREQAELKPVSVTSTNGAWLVNFGRCIDGWPKLTLRGNRPGDIVRLEYFQMSGERKPAGWDEYICHGGTETWDADFGRHTSFQEIKITGYSGPLKASDIGGIWAYCDADVAGHFRCSNGLLNDIYEMCERSARQNIQQGIISVDANREQSPWTADSWNVGNVLLYNHRDTMMLDKVVRDYAAEQFPNGDFPACCPAHRGGDYTPPGQASRRIPEWSMYWPMLLWEQYLFSGDATLLRAMAPRLTHFLEWLKTFQDPSTKLIDPPGWRISEYAGGNMPSGGYNTPTACQYYENLRIASRVFSVLGQSHESQGYAREAEAVKNGINSDLFNGEFYLARTDRKEMFPLASAWALRFDVVPEAAKPKVLSAIENGGKPRIGGYGGDAFYSGLLNAGGGVLVVRDLNRYRPMLEENKANWESFQFDKNIEVNHAWTAYPGYLFPKYILGIQPTSGGFATFDLRPETGGLTFAEGTVPTVKGDIKTRWETSTDGNFSLSVHVPANTRAAIYIPKLVQNFTISESGKLLWPRKSQLDDPGVLAVMEKPSSLQFSVGAGDYRFRETPSSP
jgi:alpha-L-rhamnosidase